MINCGGSPDECHCFCHGPNGEPGVNAKHVVACCYQCANCNRNISTYSWENHEKTCGFSKEKD